MERFATRNAAELAAVVERACAKAAECAALQALRDAGRASLPRERQEGAAFQRLRARLPSGPCRLLRPLQTMVQRKLNAHTGNNTLAAAHK